MKISKYTPSYIYSKKEPPSETSGSESQKSFSEEKHEHNQKKKNPDYQEILEAKDIFEKNGSIQGHGITATIENRAGLTVILKDKNGYHIRQLSGEEFVTLKESNATELKIPGKIFDQKA